MSQHAVSDQIPDTSEASEHLGELRPVGCHYSGVGEVTFTFMNKAGNRVLFTATSLLAIEIANMTNRLIVTQDAQIFRNLGQV